MFSSLRLAAFAYCALIFSTKVFGLVVPMKRAQLCNGHSDLCSRPYGNVTFLGAHDSFAFSSFPLALARTQEVDVETQLMHGARLLQAQGHMNGDQVHFCHTSCGLFDGGSALSYLQNVRKFLLRFPNEVLTLIIANPEELSIDDIWAPVFNESGIADMAYIPPRSLLARDQWPTLYEMIETGRRVVIFIDKGAEASQCTAPYVMPQFKMMWEDKYDPVKATFPCSVDRTTGPFEPSQQLNLINHNLNVDLFPVGRGLRIPDRLRAPKTNSIVSILNHAAHCSPLANYRNPNFVLTDFTNVGQALNAVDRLNGFGPLF
jgi:hypothetical protein